MKTMKAVVVRGLNDYAVEEVTLDAPKADEVLVKIKATGICHSDSRYPVVCTELW
jgi:S-(hydroxymethyl)glutathione dehydrogenase/alcohol dehydrogenase